MRTFGDFLSRADRENREHLRIIGHILDKAEFRVRPHLDNKEPYLYVGKPDIAGMDDIQFNGIRIYCRGKDIMCFRTQMEEKAEPFGETYHLDVGGMYKDLIADEPKKTPYLIIYHIIQELKSFFIQCAAAEEDKEEKKDSQMGSIVVGASGAGDYSNQVLNTQRQ